MSAYLQYCGLDIGKKLIGPKRGNIKGHFEDELFVRFHKDVLKKNKQHMFLPEEIGFDEKDKSNARQLIDSQDKTSLWGWKDPRTIIFLYDWEAILGEKAKYIFIYRPPDQVVDSLLRRNTDLILRFNPFIAAKSWLLYNQRIVNFCRETGRNFALFNFDDILKEPRHLVYFINKDELYQINEKKIEEIYDSNLFKKNIGLWRSKLVNIIYRKQFNSLWSQLEGLRIKNENTLS
ncbi:MAG: hypothetical protein D3911_05735 [Candidatus Electrothrix sp. AW3_4]|nr:hypothetical protein [Candidatus Electrothrix gigas]